MATSSRGHVEQYLAQFPEHKQAALRYLATGGCFDGSRYVSYTTRAVDNAGRIYAVEGGAQLLVSLMLKLT